MNLNGSLALRFAAVVAISAAASNAFAFGGLFDGGLFKNICASKNAPVVEDDSFFAGQAITLGEMEFDPYQESALDGLYGECAACAGGASADAGYVDGGYAGASFADGGFVDGGYYGGGYVTGMGVPSAVTYGASYVYDNLPGYSYAPYAWNGGYRPFQPVRNVLRAQPVRSILRGVRNLLFGGGYSYCQPAYVCDPCWSVCDPCWSPCACDVCNPCDVCAPCEPACNACEPVCDAGCAGYSPAVYAPRSCCGDGYAPGVVNPLDPTTGRPAQGGVDSAVSSPAPKSVSSYDEPSDSDASSNAPAVPGSLEEPNSNAIPSYDSGSETIPTPQADPRGAGVLKMLVPEDSVVYVNGYRTKQTGAMRTFSANNLEYGETYSFEIRVVAKRDGRVYEDVQTTTLTAGDSTALAFNLTLRDNEAYAYNK